MNIKALIAIVAILAMAIFGYSYYSSKKHEEQLAAMRAESAKVQAEATKLEAEQNQEKQQKLMAQLKQEQQAKKLTEENNKADKLAKSQLEDFSKKWFDIVNIAGGTSRIALPPVIKDLQKIRQDVETIETGTCTKQAKSDLLEAMNYIEKGYLAFMSDTANGDSDLIENSDKAKPLIKSYKESIDKCKF